MERRLVFGGFAERYDRHRPSYPAALIDDLVQLGGRDRPLLEVGAGTGKATRLFAERGVRIYAVEPSAEMAAVLRSTVADPLVEVVEADFEDWDPGGATFPLLFSAQAWHWIDPERGYPQAWAVLEPGAWLAPFWNQPCWSGSRAQEVLLPAYRRAGFDAGEHDPMHPAAAPPSGDDLWLREIGAQAGFDGAEVREYPWRVRYTAGDYAALLETHSALHVVDPAQRDALLAAVRQAILAAGDELELPMVTRLCLARRV